MDAAGWVYRRVLVNGILGGMNIHIERIETAPSGHDPSRATPRENLEAAANGDPSVTTRDLAQALIQVIDELEAVKADLASVKKS